MPEPCSRRRRRRRRFGVVALLISCIATLVLSAAAAPVGAGVQPPDTSVPAEPGADLPPPDRDSLARIFDPALLKLGLRTTRAALVSTDGYSRSATGTHLAVYVEPTSRNRIDDGVYVDHIVELARLYLPTVFKRWGDLKSFDVCQEPEPLYNPGPVPPPITQFQVTRAVARTVKWQRADLAELLALAAEEATEEGPSGDRNSFFLYISPRLRDDPTYVRARKDAGLPPITAATTSTTRASTSSSG